MGGGPTSFQHEALPDPLPLRLNKEQTAAVEKELARLVAVGAIEPAPHHDGDKPLSSSHCACSL